MISVFAPYSLLIYLTVFALTIARCTGIFFLEEMKYSESLILLMLLICQWVLNYFVLFKENSPEIMDFRFRLVGFSNRKQQFKAVSTTSEIFWNKLHIQLELTNPIKKHIFFIIITLLSLRSTQQLFPEGLLCASPFARHDTKKINISAQGLWGWSIKVLKLVTSFPHLDLYDWQQFLFLKKLKAKSA